MGYVNQTLRPGERVRYRARLSWVIFLPPIFVLVIGVGFMPTHPGVTALLFFVALIWAISALIDRLATEIAVTDGGLIVKRGFIARDVVEVSARKIEAVNIIQSLAGRVFNHGMVSVTGTGTTLCEMKAVDDPLALKAAISDLISGN